MKKLTAISFLIMLAACFCCSILAFFDKHTVSLEENRKFETLPAISFESYFSSQFMRSFENYLSDHFPYRSKALLISRLFDRFKGCSAGVQVVAKQKNESEEFDFSSLTGIAHSADDFSEFRTRKENSDILSEEDRIVSMFGFDDKTVLSYSDTLLALKRGLNAGGRSVRVFSLLAPSYVGVWHEKYSDYSDPQERAIGYAYDLMRGYIEPVDAYSELMKHRDEYIYFRTDHHWTHLGAYYAAKAFTEQAGVLVPDIEDYAPHRLENFLGYQYRQHPSDSLESNPDYIDYYMRGEDNPAVSVFFYLKDANGETMDELSSFESRVFTLANAAEQASYGIFMVGDYPVIVYENADADESAADTGISRTSGGRNLLIIKDSYANAFSTWLIRSFDKIVIVDPRHYKGSIYDIAELHDISDVVVMNYANVLSMPKFVQYLREIMGE